VIDRRLRRPDGSEVEINRQCRCLVAHRSQPAPPDINDEVPY
jgi:hypothetical protein